MQMKVLTLLVATGPKAVGGNVMNHSCATIIALRKGRGEERVAKVIDSPGMQCSHLCNAQAHR